MPARRKPTRTKTKAARTRSARPKSKAAAARRPTARTPAARPDVPQFFRLNIEVGNLDEADRFYGTLLGLRGRRQAGSRVYFQAGPVTLQVVDVSTHGRPHPAAKALYFTVRDLDAAFARAQALGCLSRE